MMRLKGLIPAVPTVILLLSAASACGGGGNDAVRADHATGIIGHWQLREVNNGVTYDIKFNPDSTIEQHFRAADGYERRYPGFYSINGDTLKIDERREVSEMVVSELNDSVMILLRADSSAVVFDRLP